MQFSNNLKYQQHQKRPLQPQNKPSYQSPPKPVSPLTEFLKQQCLDRARQNRREILQRKRLDNRNNVNNLMNQSMSVDPCPSNQSQNCPNSCTNSPSIHITTQQLVQQELQRNNVSVSNDFNRNSPPSFQYSGSNLMSQTIQQDELDELIKEIEEELYAQDLLLQQEIDLFELEQEKQEEYLQQQIMDYYEENL